MAGAVGFHEQLCSAIRWICRVGLRHPQCGEGQSANTSAFTKECANRAEGCTSAWAPRFLMSKYARCPIDALNGPKIRSVGKVKLIAAADFSFLRRVRVAVSRNASLRASDAGSRSVGRRQLPSHRAALPLSDHVVGKIPTMEPLPHADENREDARATTALAALRFFRSARWYAGR